MAIRSMLDTDPSDPVIAFDNSYARLPDHFYARLPPTPVSAPSLIRLNTRLAAELGLDADALSSPLGVAILAGNRVPAGAEPIAAAYAGHQFGGFNPKLGDGRAILLGEVIAPDGQRFDLQLKGSGPTPFSRAGDGRAALGPVLREYIVSEAMAALGIPTTRSLAAVATGDAVHRERPLPGAVLTRVAASHIRVGTFQYFAVRRDVDALRELCGYVIARHYPDLAHAANPALALLRAIVDRQAGLIAQWMLIGFIHGVMNTDNCSIAGESIDFGPCAFMDAYNPGAVYSSIDSYGRYAYSNQPDIAHWNLARLAETLLPLIDDDTDAAIAKAMEPLDAFPAAYEAAYNAGMRRKLGLLTEQPGDAALGQDLLAAMARASADMTNTFRALSETVPGIPRGADARAQFTDATEFDVWAVRWRARIDADGGDDAERRVMMRAANPAYIPRNHRIEEAIVAAVDGGDFSPFNRLVDILARPFDDQPDAIAYRDPPKPEEIVRATFCGT